ncbi:MAG: LLM class oxidoreductase [Methylotenera sp.]|nr:LLM class oxidoreductase [Methylotenera sp.]
MYTPNPNQSPTANRGWQRVFQRGKLTLGIMFPIEAFERDQPTMHNQVALAQFAEKSGFASLGFRDVPLKDPNFGDVGQIFDPWAYLGYMAAQTSEIALLTASIILPLRHPIHIAKAAASIDRLSNGRLLMGVATGDRVVEFPAFNVDFESRGAMFREEIELLKIYWSELFPQVSSSFGDLQAADVIPKPIASHVPLLVTGHSQQDLAWIARNADGWMSYPRNIEAQAQVVARWRDSVEAELPGQYKPFTQSYFIDLADSPNEAATPIHLGHRLDRNALLMHLRASKRIGVDHLIFNLKYGKRAADEVLQELAEFVLPEFM